MQTVVLAAGEGTRMRPLTATRPKPMLPVVDRPLVAHTLDAAASAGASRFIFVVGYEQTAVREYFGAEYAGVPIDYTVQSAPQGTADAVRAAQEFLHEDVFVVLNGDALYDHDQLRHLYRGEPALGAYRVENPSAYGVLQTDYSGHFVEGVVEKPAVPSSNRINTGVYAFPEEAQSWLNVDVSDRGELELTDVLARTCREYDVQVVSFDRWLDVGRPWELFEANEWHLEHLSRDIRGDVDDNANISGNVVIEDDAVIRSGVTIQGPVLVRSGATIGPNAYIRGSTVIGEDASIGHAVEVKNSLIMRGVNVNHLSYVGDSILGRNVNFGAGTNVANLRHDDQLVKYTVKGDRVSTGRRKFGVVAGDEVNTGINTSLNPGVTLSTGKQRCPVRRCSKIGKA